MERLSKAKVIIHCIVLFAVMFLANLITSLPFDILFQFISLPYSWMYGVLRVGTYIAFTLFLFHQYSTRILNCDIKFFRWGILKLKSLDAILALLLPAMVIICYITFGTVSVNDNLTVSTICSVILVSLLRAFESGLLEEILFRGFMLKLIEIKWNRYTAVIAPSLIFSLVHIPSMGTFRFMDLFLLICSGTLVGILFSVATYKNNSIWGSALIHIVWNFLMISNVISFGSEVNNNAIISIVFSTDNTLLTGGSFGIESSIISIVAYLIIILIMLLYIRHKNHRIK